MLVHRAKDQCAFIKAHCADADSGLISYLSLYFCHLQHAKPVALAILALWLSVLFMTIGIAASDFFCVNLSTIATVLGMSENVAGVTFLAFGNGSPDVFSTFAAMNSHSGSLAVGELIGAAGFITSVVAGSMALVQPFKVTRSSFVRDVSFFIVAVSFCMVFLADGRLQVWECAVMVGFYCVYVAFVLASHWHLRRRRRKGTAGTRSGRTSSGDRRHLLREDSEGAGRHHAEDAFDGSIAQAARRSLSPETPELSTKATPNTPLITTNEGNDNDDGDDEEDNNDEENEEEEGEEDMDEEELPRGRSLAAVTNSMRINHGPGDRRRPTLTSIRPSLMGALEFRATMFAVPKARAPQHIPLPGVRRHSYDPTLTRRGRPAYWPLALSEPPSRQEYAAAGAAAAIAAMTAAATGAPPVLGPAGRVDAWRQHGPAAGGGMLQPGAVRPRAVSAGDAIHAPASSSSSTGGALAHGGPARHINLLSIPHPAQEELRRARSQHAQHHHHHHQSIWSGLSSPSICLSPSPSRRGSTASSGGHLSAPPPRSPHLLAPPSAVGFLGVHSPLLLPLHEPPQPSQGGGSSSNGGGGAHSLGQAHDAAAHRPGVPRLETHQRHNSRASESLPASPFPQFVESPQPLPASPAYKPSSSHEFPFLPPPAAAGIVAAQGGNGVGEEDDGGYGGCGGGEDGGDVCCACYGSRSAARLFPPLSVVLATLFPTLRNWRSKSAWERVLGAVAAPSIFLLTITLPVVESDGEPGQDERRAALHDEENAAADDTAEAANPIRILPPEEDEEEDGTVVQNGLQALGLAQTGITAAALTNTDGDTSVKSHLLPHANGLANYGSVGHSPADSMQQKQQQQQSHHHHDHHHHYGHHHHHHYHQQQQASYAHSPTDQQQPIATKGWNRWLACLQCFIAPPFVVLVIWANTADSDPDPTTDPASNGIINNNINNNNNNNPHLALLPAPLCHHPLLTALLCSLAVSAGLTTALVALTSPARPPRRHYALSFAGFVVGVAWISSIAGEVVGVLKALGVALGVSDAVLGVTVFAVGNSLGDLVANTTIARLGFHVMALSACFGGPLLNILLGIGVGGLYRTLRGHHPRHYHQHHPHAHPHPHPHPHPGHPTPHPPPHGGGGGGSGSGDVGSYYRPYVLEVSPTLVISGATLLATLLGLLIVVPLNGWRLDRRIGWGLVTLWVVSTVANVALEITGWSDRFS